MRKYRHMLYGILKMFAIIACAAAVGLLVWLFT